MYALRVHIAEHMVLFRTDSKQVLQYLNRTFHTVVLADDQSVIRPDLNVMIRGGYGKAFNNYDVKVEVKTNQYIYSRSDYRIEMEVDYRSANVYVYDDFALKHALVNVYSAFIIHREWGLLVHSSCILERGHAYLFAGQSGAGKSTVAQLSMPRSILSDEATIMKVTPTGVTIFPSPFRSDTEMPSDTGVYPLTAIQLLRQAKVNERIGISKIDGMLQLVNRVFYWAHDPFETRKVLRMCKEIGDHVPIYELHFQKNNTFWEAIS
jgi:hypothetical protein